MISKARIKFINQLKLKKYRDSNALFIAEGHRNVIDFLSGDIKLKYLYALESWFDKAKCTPDNNKFNIANTDSLKKISALKTPPEVVAVFEIPDYEDLVINRNNLYLALDDISDPGNLGTIIRTADWFGITDIICSKNTVDYLNPKVVQATMGSLSRVKLHYCDLAEAIRNTDNKIAIYGAFLNGQSIAEISSPASGIIVIGSEAHGISPEIGALVTNKITIPGFESNRNSKPESLNASIATAIICYAFKNQK